MDYFCVARCCCFSTSTGCRMKRIDSLISLVKSLSKSERKAVSMYLVGDDNRRRDYLVIYQIISEAGRIGAREVRKAFSERCPGGAFEVSVQYLYRRLTDTLLALRRGKDRYHDLLTDICKARMMYDRSLFEECFGTLVETIDKAMRLEYYEIANIAMKLELEYLLRLDFQGLTEKDLYHKHFMQTESLKKIRKITEQSFLHNLLKFRLSHHGAIRTAKQKQDMNDLMINELYITSSAEAQGEFELVRNHKLFQANFLMGTGDYHAALNAFRELNQLFESNRHMWFNPPIYYLSVLEGVLGSLRSIGNYGEMSYFMDRLRGLISTAGSPEFRVNALCLLFQYELFPYLDRGDFNACVRLMEKYRESLYEKESALTPVRKSELLLYTALIYIGMQNYTAARRQILKSMVDHNIRYLPLMRTIRLVRLIAYYETQEYEAIHRESQSILRSLSSSKERTFRTERFVLWFLRRNNLPVMPGERKALWKSIAPKVAELHGDVYEQQLLRIFDFTAWVESKILRTPLSTVLQRNASAR